MALRLEILELSGKVSRSAEFGRNRAYGMGTAGAPKRVKQGGFAPSLQCLHKVCIKSAMSAISTLDAHF
jgi:hypothetical protein